MIGRDLLFPKALMQTVVKASCTRRVGKDVFSTIDEITREYFEVCISICLCGWMDGWMDGWIDDVGYGRPIR